MSDRRLEGDGQAPFPEIRLLTCDDWRTVREGRLAALKDAPDAFLTADPHEATWTEGQWRESCDTGDWVVAQLDGRVVATTRLARQGEYPYVESVWTAADYRRRGIASELVRQLVKAQRQRRAGEIRVWVFSPNPAAFQFYASLGFEPTGTRQLIDGTRMEERLRLIDAG